jgi:3-mercaptopyruvate sulfurtransferase SseA
MKARQKSNSNLSEETARKRRAHKAGTGERLAVVALLPRLVRGVKGRCLIDGTTFKNRPEIDVRGADEFQGPLGHLAGAINIPLAALPAKIRELTEFKRRPIVTV